MSNYVSRLVGDMTFGKLLFGILYGAAIVLVVLLAAGIKA